MPPALPCTLVRSPASARRSPRPSNPPCCGQAVVARIARVPPVSGQPDGWITAHADYQTGCETVSSHASHAKVGFVQASGTPSEVPAVSTPALVQHVARQDRMLPGPPGESP